MTDNRATAGKFTWSAIKPKLSRLFDAQSPHVRANLAVLAAAMAPDPGAIEELAKIGVDAVNGLVNKRDGASEVIATVLREREALSVEDRTEFDRLFIRYLRPEADKWQANALVTLFRDEVPIELVPVKYVVREIFEVCGNIPINARTPQEIASLHQQRERVREVAVALSLPELEGYKHQLVSIAADRLRGEEKDRRNALTFGLLELWPEMARDIHRKSTKDGKASLVQAARMGRTNIFQHILPAIGITVLTVMLLFVLPGFCTAFLHPEAEGSGPGNQVGAAIFYGLMVAGIALAAALPAMVFYIPTSALRLKPWIQAQVNIWSVCLMAMLLAVGCSLVLLTIDSNVLAVEALVVSFGLALLGGFATVILLPLVVRFEHRFSRNWYLVNPFTLAAPQLFVSLGLLVKFPLEDGRAVGTIWVLTVVSAVAFSSVVWRSEKRRAGGEDKAHNVPPHYRYYGGAMLICSALVAGIMIAPAGRLLFSAISPAKVTLDQTHPEARISSGVIFKVNSDRPFSVNIEQGPDYRFDHVVSSKSPSSAKWDDSDYVTSLLPSNEHFKTHPKFVSAVTVADGKAEVCYDCFQGNGSMGQFMEIVWPFRNADRTLVKVVRGIHGGDVVQFGKYFSMKLNAQACLRVGAQTQVKLWNVSEETYNDFYEEYSVEYSSVSSETPTCEDNEIALGTGKYQICLHALNAAPDCARGTAFPKGANVKGSDRIALRVIETPKTDDNSASSSKTTIEDAKPLSEADLNP